MIKLGIDVMGGDFAPNSTLEAISEYLKNIKDDVEIYLYGDNDKIKEYISNNAKVKIIDTKDFIRMDEKDAVKKVRTDKTSSLYLGLNALKEREIDGFLSAGPTGPVVTYAQLIVKRIPGIRKIALTAEAVTGINPHKYILLDVGANIDVQANNLVQFAKSGTVYAREILGISNPRVALVCNGVEKGKGREIERAVYDLLEADSSINFVGYMEPSDMLNNNVDVVVSDGFTMNMVMKTAEGTLKNFGRAFKKTIKSKLKNKIAYLLLKKDLKEIFDLFGQKDTGAAMLLGINGAVLKAHGNSTKDEFLKAIIQLEKACRNDVVKKITESVSEDND